MLPFWGQESQASSFTFQQVSTTQLNNYSKHLGTVQILIHRAVPENWHCWWGCCASRLSPKVPKNRCVYCPQNNISNSLSGSLVRPRFALFSEDIYQLQKRQWSPILQGCFVDKCRISLREGVAGGSQQGDLSVFIFWKSGPIWSKTTFQKSTVLKKSPMAPGWWLRNSHAFLCFPWSSHPTNKYSTQTSRAPAARAAFSAGSRVDMERSIGQHFFGCELLVLGRVFSMYFPILQPPFSGYNLLILCPQSNWKWIHGIVVSSAASGGNQPFKRGRPWKKNFKTGQKNTVRFPYHPPKRIPTTGRWPKIWGLWAFLACIIPVNTPVNNGWPLL